MRFKQYTKSAPTIHQYKDLVNKTREKITAVQKI